MFLKNLLLVILCSSIFQVTTHATNIKVIQTDDIQSMSEGEALNEVFRYMVATTHHINEYNSASASHGAIYAMGGIYISGQNGHCLYLCGHENDGEVTFFDENKMGIFSSGKKPLEENIKLLHEERESHVVKQIFSDHENLELSEAEKLSGIVDTFEGKGIREYVGKHMFDAEGHLLDRMCYDIMHDDKLRHHLFGAYNIVPFIFTERDPCRCCMISIGSFLKEKIFNVFSAAPEADYHCSIKTVVGTLGHYQEKTISRKGSHYLRYEYQWLDKGVEISDDLFHPMWHLFTAEDDEVSSECFDVVLYHISPRIAHEAIVGVDQKLYDFFKSLSVSILKHEDTKSSYSVLFGGDPSSKMSYCDKFWADIKIVRAEKTKRQDEKVIKIKKQYEENLRRFESDYSDILSSRQKGSLSPLIVKTFELKKLYLEIVLGNPLEDKALILQEEIKGDYAKLIKKLENEKGRALQKAYSMLSKYHKMCLNYLFTGLRKKVPVIEKRSLSDIDFDRCFNANNEVGIPIINYIL